MIRKRIRVSVSDGVYLVLKQIAADGKFKSVTKLVESILCEIALDEADASDLTNTKKQPQSPTSVSVA